MLARGKLAGVLVLGERKGGESYAPDEIEALSQFAHGVGSALGALSVENGASLVALQESLAARQEAAVARLEEIAEALRSERRSTE